MSNIAIRVENLSKQYYIGGKREPYKTLRDAVTEAFVAPFRRAGKLLRGQATGAAGLDEVIWALNDLSFNIKHGDVVGIIGRNGAGKSTLLKVLSRITEPTRGCANIHGRVGSLLEVGTGFHPELTGRENIYLNGAIIGMRRAEINRKFDEIVAFSEVEKFIETPVKYYSSGMQLRLAFAVAAHLEPEILLIDEVLAVGDVTFQKKCLGKMNEVAREGRTVLFVSHNMAAIQSLCSSAYLLEAGQLANQGEPQRVIAYYLKKSQSLIDSISLAERTDRRGSGAMRFEGVRFYDEEGKEICGGQTGSSLTIGVQYMRTEQANQPAVVRIAITNMFGQRLFMCLSRSSYNGSLKLQKSGEVLCQIPKLPLLPGCYTGSLWCKIGNTMADELNDAFVLNVMESDFFGTGKLHPPDGGDMLVSHFWEVR